MQIFWSGYIFFGSLALVLNIITAVVICNKYKRVDAKIVVKCGVIETIGILVGAKISDFILNFEHYTYLANDKEFFQMVISGYDFLGAVVGAFVGIAIYAIIREKDFEELCNIYLPNLLLVYAIGKIGCFFAGCCRGIVISNYPLPIQLIESVIYFILYCTMLRFSEWNNKKIYMLCMLFGGMRFLIGFFRESIYDTYISVSQIFALCIFFVGLRFYFAERKSKIKLKMS